MDIFKRWREAGWNEIDSKSYEAAYYLFGGSVATHPRVIDTLSRMTEMPLRYLGQYCSDTTLIGAIPVWGKYIAGSKVLLKKKRQAHVVDMGNAEVILPLSPEHRFNLGFKANFLSALHQSNITNIRAQNEDTISLLKSYRANAEFKFSRKFKYNQRRELRLFEEAGGYYQSVESLGSQSFSAIYIELFEKRWQKKPKGHERLAEFLARLKDLQQGYVLFDKQDQPVAIQLLLLAESPRWISVEYINGGVDPVYKSMSVGSILSYLNTKHISEIAETRGKPLRFSFGKSDKVYKDLWCYRSDVFRV